MPKTLVLSIGRDQFDVETFRAGGHGGQNQNKRDTGVRIRHRASGAVSESRRHRTQGQNRKAAFLKLTKTAAWRVWLARQLGEPESAVDQWMQPEHLLIEVRDGRGNWARA